MTIGAPIDSIIRSLVNPATENGFTVPDSVSNLDPSPQVVMSAKVIPPVFQSSDGLGNPEPASAAAYVYDYITVLIEKPTNKTYVVGYDVPFDIIIYESVYAFDTGPGSAVISSGTVSKGGNITVVVSGTTSASANLHARITTKTQGVP